jgi:hypothetical protein
MIRSITEGIPKSFAFAQQLKKTTLSKVLNRVKLKEAIKGEIV